MHYTNFNTRHENTQINSFLDAVWWTVSTVTTVGYGDIVPVTDAGKIMAIFYMIFGIGVLAISLSVLGTRIYKTKIEICAGLSSTGKRFLARHTYNIKSRVK